MPGAGTMRAAGSPAKRGDTARGTPTAPQHSKDLEWSSEQQPLYRVGANTLGSKAFPSQTP